jgi:hypothetical protein
MSDNNDDQYHNHGDKNDNGSKMDSEEVPAPAAASSNNDSGPYALRPVFLGNLTPGFEPNAAIDLFERPIQPTTAGSANQEFAPMPVERIDLKRGYCFVFLNDVATRAQLAQTEAFVALLHGMYVTLHNSTTTMHHFAATIINYHYFNLF